jgi:uncharacterized membrane protein
MAGFWLAALTLLYPFMITMARGHVEPRWLSLLLVVLALARIPSARRNSTYWWTVAAPAFLAIVTFLSNGELPLRLYPVLVNLALGLLFGWSLLHPPTVIERIARLTDPLLPPRAVTYTRKVTQVWLGFFVINGSIALITALWASPKVWTLYNGGIAYALMGVLFAVEWVIRQRVKKQISHG